MTGEPLHVLFLCPDNACRSIMAEALLNTVGQGRFCAFSAGNRPSGAVNPYVIETLKQVGYDTSGLFSKNWNTFTVPSAARLDAVVTLAASLQSALLPVWYSNPVHVHWGMDNPEQVEGGDRERIGAYRRCYGDMEQQMLKFAGLKIDGVRGPALLRLLQSIAPAR